MKTKTIELFDYEELDQKAKDKARQDWNQNNFDPYYVQVDLDNLADELLPKYGIKVLTDLKGYETKHPRIYWSLSSCQGDGVVFEGVFEFEGQTVRVEHTGRYTHSYSKTVTWQDFTGEEKETEEEALAGRFEEAYQKVCSELEKAGYQAIEGLESEEYFIETCNANEYTFRKDGTMENDN